MAGNRRENLFFLGKSVRIIVIHAKGIAKYKGCRAISYQKVNVDIEGEWVL